MDPTHLSMSYGNQGLFVASPPPAAQGPGDRRVEIVEPALAGRGRDPLHYMQATYLDLVD